MSDSRRAFRNTALLFAVHSANGISFYILFAVVGRTLGETRFGAFSATLVAVSLLNAVCSMGTDAYIVREVAKRGATRETVAQPFALRLLAGALAVAIASVWIRAFAGAGLPLSPEILAGLSIYVFSMLPTTVSQVAWAVSDGLERMEYRAILSGALFAGKAAIGATLVLRGHAVSELFVALLAIDVAVAIASWIAISPYVRGRSPSWSPRRLARLARTMFPFALLVALQLVYLKIDVMMLAAMRDDAEVGWYSAASRILEGFLVVPMAVVGSLYPLMSRALHAQDREITPVLTRSVKYLLGVGAPLTIGMWLLAEPFLLVLFGREYLPHSPRALAVLIWTVLFYYTGAPLGRTLFVLERQGFVLRLFVAGALVNIGLNALLIPRYGFLGAAWATLLSEIVVFVVMFYALTRALGAWWPGRRTWLIPLTSMLSAIPLLPNVGGEVTTAAQLAVRVGTQVLLYGLLTMSFRVLDCEDRSLLGKIMRR